MEKITGIIRAVRLIGAGTLHITLAIDGGEISGVMPGDSTLKALLPVGARADIEFERSDGDLVKIKSIAN